MKYASYAGSKVVYAVLNTASSILEEESERQRRKEKLSAEIIALRSQEECAGWRACVCLRRLPATWASLSGNLPVLMFLSPVIEWACRGGKCELYCTQCYQRVCLSHENQNSLECTYPLWWCLTFSMVEYYSDFLESSQMVFVSIKWRISTLNWSVGWIDRQIVLMIIYLCLFQTPQPLYKAIMAFSSQVHDSYYTNTVPSRLSLCRFFHMAIGVSQTWGFISESWHFVSESIYP